jgi:hypothetical protein
MSISAMKQALDAIETYGPEYMHGLSKKHYTKTLRQAIAEAEKQEPLVWMNKYGHVASFKNDEYTAPLYTRPVVHEVRCTYPQCQETNGCVGVCSKGQPDLARVGEVGVWGDKREWVGLTNDDINFYWAIATEREAERHFPTGHHAFAFLIQDKLKRLNT